MRLASFQIKRHSFPFALHSIHSIGGQKVPCLGVFEQVETARSANWKLSTQNRHFLGFHQPAQSRFLRKWDKNSARPIPALGNRQNAHFSGTPSRYVVPMSRYIPAQSGQVFNVQSQPKRRTSVTRSATLIDYTYMLACQDTKAGLGNTGSTARKHECRSAFTRKPASQKQWSYLTKSAPECVRA